MQPPSKFINPQTKDYMRAKAGISNESRLKELEEFVAAESKDLTQAIANQEEDHQAIEAAKDLTLAMGRKAHLNMLNLEDRMMRNFLILIIAGMFGLVGTIVWLIKLSTLILK